MGAHAGPTYRGTSWATLSADGAHVARQTVLESDRRPTELAEFLAVRRARLTPQDVGLDGPAARRRVPGLRREELARLAGVSVDYYTRLEQGRSRSASADVLDALATALQLNDAERQHLQLLAKPQPAQRKRRFPSRNRSIRRHCGCWSFSTKRGRRRSCSAAGLTLRTTDWRVR